MYGTCLHQTMRQQSTKALVAKGLVQPSRSIARVLLLLFVWAKKSGRGTRKGRRVKKKGRGMAVWARKEGR